MSDKDPDKHREEPAKAGEGDAEHGAPEGDTGSPPPATWAGRVRKGGDDKADLEDPGETAEDLDEPPHGEFDPAEDLEGLPAGDENQPDDEHLDDEPADEFGGDGHGDPELTQDTIEADTLALADREAAREAALAGLRARAAEHAAKHGAGTGAPAHAPPEPEAEPAKEAEKPPPVPVATPPAEPGKEGPPSRRGLWMRFVAGSFLIVVSVATATAISLLFFLNGILDDVRGLASVRSQLTAANPGHPQTILILGSDKRPKGQEIGARSDTTILLRVASDQITVLSIPRDLKVNIPGHGIDKFNAAYSYGGPKLTLKVVKQLTGITDINHVINVDFTGFADAVNAIGCVYVDVDHHYYHSNVGLAPADQYAAIDIPAGYQRMCGYNALQYVRYRHDDNDLVRSARQQEFLREARQELPWSKVLGDFSQLVDILKKYVTSDIQRETDLISLAELFVAARHAPVVQVHFPANLGGPTAAYVTASASAIRQAVAKFEGTAPPPPPVTSRPSGSGPAPNGGKKKHAKPAPPPALADFSTTAQQFSGQLAAAKTKSGKQMIDFPIYYPTKLAPSSEISSDSRAFPIDGPGNEVFRGYKIVVSLPTDGYVAYYGISGTDWPDPPILSNPDETRTINGKQYLLSWDGPELRLIGWKTAHGSYWVDNTLLNVLTPGQMFGIAQSMRKYTG